MSARSKKKQSIVIATHNPDKLTEMQTVLRGLDIPLLTLSDFPEIDSIEETGTTLEENSLIKARTVYKITKLPVIADDTGLEVDALNGDPGVFTGRYAGENATYKQNIDKLLLALQEVPNEKRTARFRTVVSFIDDTKELQTEGLVQGIITEDPKGNKGFGYDPVFFIPDLNKTFAELEEEEKNKISHRGLALQNLRKLLKDSI